MGVEELIVAVPIILVLIVLSLKLLSSSPNDDNNKMEEDEETEEETEDESEDEESDETDEDEDGENTVTCDVCGTEFPESEVGTNVFYFEEGYNVDDFHICRACIDKKYKPEGQVIEKIVEKEVYVSPENNSKTSRDIFGKTKFD